MLPLIPLALSLAPQIGKWLFGESGEKVTSAVAQAVQTVTGTSDPEAAEAAIARDPKVAADLQVALAKIAADAEAAARQSDLDAMKATLADVAGARAQTVELAKDGSRIAWSAPVLSAVILIAFAAMLYVVLTQAVPESSAKLADILLGTLAAMAAHIEKLTAVVAGK